MSAVRELYPFKKDMASNPGRYTTMEKGIQCLRELAVVDMMYSINLNENTNSYAPEDKICM